MKRKCMLSQLAIVLFFLSSTFTYSQALPIARVLDLRHQVKLLTGEELPNMTTLSLDTAKARTLITTASQNIRLHNVPLQPYYTEITNQALTSLKALVTISTCSASCSTYSIAGVRMIYGQQGDNLVLYYQTVLLCSAATSTINSEGIKLRAYNLCQYGSFYTYNGTQFTPLAAGNMHLKDSAVVLYKRKKSSVPIGSNFGVEILSQTNVWEEYNETGDEDGSGNVREIVYPIQELISGTGGAGGKIKLWSVVNALKVVLPDGTEKIINKHDVILSSSNITYATTLNIPNTAKVYDYSHICPPSCNGLRFLVRVN